MTAHTRPVAAAAHIVGAMALIGCVDNFVRLIASEAGLWQFHLTRSAMAGVMLAVGAAVLGWRLHPRRWGAVALRSLLLSAAMVLYFGALAVLPIAQVGAALFTAPIFVLLISAFVFGVAVGPWRVLAVALGFAGVLVMLRPDAGNLTLMTVMPVCAGFLYALAAIVTRRHCADEATMTLQAGFFAGLAFWSVIGLAVLHGVGPARAAAAAGEGFFLRGWVAPTGAFLFWTFVQAAGSLAGVGLLTRAYQLGEPSYVAVFEYSFLVFAGGWAWLLWGEVLDPVSWLGIAAIAASGLVIALRSR
jgi:drug/metabolite transporter (DMT)-like permease